MPVLVNFILFQLAWLACVLGAAQGHPWFGPLVVACVVAYHLQRAANPGPEAMLLLSAALIGTLFDSALVASGWLVYPAGQWHPLVAPYWIIALWVAFASTLNVSLNWLKGRPLLSVLFGTLGGPLAYLAGARLGGVEFTEQAWALGALGLGWALLTPLLVALSARLNGWKAPADRQVLATATE